MAERVNDPFVGVFGEQTGFSPSESGGASTNQNTSSGSYTVAEPTSKVRQTVSTIDLHGSFEPLAARRPAGPFCKITGLRRAVMRAECGQRLGM